jgi:hypothetical protein
MFLPFLKADFPQWLWAAQAQPDIIALARGSSQPSLTDLAPMLLLALLSLLALAWSMNQHVASHTRGVSRNNLWQAVLTSLSERLS